MSKHVWMRGVWAVAIFVGTTFYAVAQQGATNADPADPQGNFNQRGTGTTQAAPMRHGEERIDHYMVKCLRMANEDEIGLARLAEQRSNDPEVKKFAAQAIEDHTKFLNRLNTFMPEMRSNRASSENPVRTGGVQINAPGTNIQVQPRTEAEGTATNRRGRRMMAHDNVVHQFGEIMQEVARQAMQSVKRELSQKEGVQFDRCFMSAQFFAHLEMVDTLTIFQQHASGELRPILQEGLQTTQQHLSQVKKILSRLEQGNARSTASIAR